MIRDIHAILKSGGEITILEIQLNTRDNYTAVAINLY
jgi:hypothetical protein